MGSEKFFHTNEHIVIVKGGFVGKVKGVILGFPDKKSASGEGGNGGVCGRFFGDGEPEGVPE